MKFVKAIVSNVGFTITFTDQFFASSTSSCMVVSKPHTS